MLKVYLATNFFNEATFEYTKKIGYRLRSLGFEVYIPQENGEINDKTSESASIITDVDIANADNKHLENSDVLVACLDGVEIDSGVSAEIGYFSGLARSEERLCASPRAKRIFGLYTDIRRDGEGDNRFYINLYTKGLVNLRGTVTHSINELADEMVKYRKELLTQKQIGGKI